MRLRFAQILLLKSPAPAAAAASALLRSGWLILRRLRRSKPELRAALRGLRPPLFGRSDRRVWFTLHPPRPLSPCLRGAPPSRVVLTSSISFAPSQAQELTHSAARPLSRQTALRRRACLLGSPCRRQSLRRSAFCRSGLPFTVSPDLRSVVCSFRRRGLRIHSLSCRQKSSVAPSLLLFPSDPLCWALMGLCRLRSPVPSASPGALQEFIPLLLCRRGNEFLPPAPWLRSGPVLPSAAGEEPPCDLAAGNAALVSPTATDSVAVLPAAARLLIQFSISRHSLPLIPLRAQGQAVPEARCLQRFGLRI